MRTSSLQLMSGLLATTLVLAASCTMDLAGLPGGSSTSDSAASGGGSTSASSTTGNGGAAASSASSVSSSGSASSAAGSSSSTGGGGGAGSPLAIAGVLLVDLDVDDPTAGAASWTNKGTLGSAFKAQGDPKKGSSGGKDAVLFDGKADAYLGPDSVATIEGNDDRSIEVWVLNSMVDPAEETMVSWSNRMPYQTGTMMSFNYGRSLGWGAVTHWDGPDLPWGSQASDAPAEAQWHHLAYTYDGTRAIVFEDGVKKNEKTTPIDTKKKFSINLAVQREGSGFEHYGSMAIAVVRIHSEALTAAEVKANYDLEKMRFQ